VEVDFLLEVVEVVLLVVVVEIHLLEQHVVQVVNQVLYL
jgi:hypothetical protein